MALRLTRALPSSSSVHRSSHHEAGENERTNDRQLVKTVRKTTSAQSMTPPQTPSHQSSPTVCAILQMGKLRLWVPRMTSLEAETELGGPAYVFHSSTHIPSPAPKELVSETAGWRLPCQTWNRRKQEKMCPWLPRLVLQL